MKRYDVTIDLDTLVCTDKAQCDIQNFTNDLTGRERQLLILMTRQSKLCHRACENLLAKIDLPSLIERGYLDTPSQDNHNHEQEIMGMGLVNEPLDIQESRAPVNDDEPNAFLQIVAGTY